jgi:catechol 2,3-dioxygenase-like lactoylglutathione lyase family enzyme
MSGFRTGPLGVGHMVYLTPDMRPLRRFYEDVLGFHLSDYCTAPFQASFYHVNPRHHSLAIAEGSASRIHHLMIEMNQLDDVGQGYDIALAEPGLVPTTLGRHINDLMMSYYVRSPDGFFIECGWGGRSIDPVTWEPFELKHGTSLWGHDRDWLGAAASAEATRLRTRAVDAGMRQPVQVEEGNYQLGAAPRAPWEGA